ncbi:MAG TPA: NADH-quinone oxidoreductase subunit NuoG [Terriglobia bacterium]|nr:NADH-quinone oxidoreductase subunit NuoG [Terriglobia bacterium]
MADVPQTVTLTIDGKPVTVPTGTLLIEAAKQASIEVPSFCYYPGYSLQGACRMCVVSIEKMPKLQTACTTVVANGMVVNTQNPEVVNGRKAMLEFLLTNHPLDCPVCDKGGECELQDAVFRYGAAETRFVETKQHEDELKFSNLVYYDRPRCILCYRCIRVCDEGMDVNAYGIGFRGSHSEIIPNRGEELECEECGMCIDICPVGALTSGTYRYKTRPWEMNYTGTICNHCGDGCKTTLSVRNNAIIRANNRDHSGFNGEFLCVKGRFGWDFVNSEKRLVTPLVRRNGSQAPASWEEALDVTVSRLKAVLETHGSGAVAIIGSNRTSNEENYLLQRLARTVLKTNSVDHHRTGDFSTLVAALSEAKATDRYATMQDVSEARSILLIGNDPTHQHPLLAFQIRQAVRSHKAQLHVVNSAGIKLALRQAAQFVRVNPGDERTVIRELAAGGGPESVSSLRAKLGSESGTIVIFGDEIRGDSVRNLVRWGLSLPGNTRFIALGDYANSRGAADMGLLPGSLPGYEPVSSEAARARYAEVWGATVADVPGRNLRQILDDVKAGQIHALLVFGSNPVKTFGLPGELLGKLDLLAVAELFATETTEFADVVLPAASFAEKSGTVTNTCGQVQAIKKTMRKAGTRSDLEIILALARELGHAWAYGSAEDVLREIITHVPAYNVALPSLMVGRAVPTRPAGAPPALERDDLVFSSRDTLFTSGTVSRFSWALNSVNEAKRPHGHIF